ncbi:BZIP transcription factor [Melia azedarach]|uniref:BZIP transcription factor n=1 Tax=Melia azedarach TaxID=155640 RepID=A0ACC1WS15_MELAZ|nr:BZIP transcription factor [Melia azedarach]
MASSSGSGNSSGSTQLQNSGSEENLQLVMDQRKRKRMQSNRESARRSRMRKQKHLDDLMAQVTQLRKDNNQILTSINITTQHYMNIENENSILRAQIMELSQRLESLNEILNFINTSNGIFESDHHQGGINTISDGFMNPMSTIYLNQPIMASPAEMFQY